MNFKTFSKYKEILGPGLLYAAAAIGVSHLVQSTRAGANYGPSLIIVVILCHLIKFPFFKVAPIYTQQTGKSILEAYKEIHILMIPLFMAMTLATMFIIQAAVTIVTAGIFTNILSINVSASYVACFLLVLCSLLLKSNKYSWLDTLVKGIIVILSLTTLLSVLMAFVDIDNYFLRENKRSFSFDLKNDLLFLVAFIGWMPAPMDIPVWHSMWVKKRQEKQAYKAGQNLSQADFLIGFIGTAFLAVAFVLLGSLVMHGKNIEFSASAISFSEQLIKLYTQTLGTWSYPIIALACLTTMFSTTLTCLDAFPRVLSESIHLLVNKKPKWDLYKVFLFITLLGTCIILLFFTKDMKSLVDFATTVSFLIAPIYAFLSYLILINDKTPKTLRISGIKRRWVEFCLLSLCLFSLYFIRLSF